MFRRRSTSAAPVVDAGSTAAQAGGKGRPTPTRKEAEAARKQSLTTPRTRKEQSAARRAQTQAARERQRLGMATGNDAYLPERDKGPVRRFARDFVDRRWCIGEVLMPLFIVVFVILLVTPTQVNAFASLAWLLVLVAMVADAVRIARGVRTGVKERFGEAETKGVAIYAILRAWQMRRLRMPKPLVGHGDSI